MMQKKLKTIITFHLKMERCILWNQRSIYVNIGRKTKLRLKKLKKRTQLLFQIEYVLVVVVDSLKERQL